MTFGIRRFGINDFHGQGHLYLAGRVLRFVLAKDWGRSLETSTGHLYLAGLFPEVRLISDSALLLKLVTGVPYVAGFLRVSGFFRVM